MAAVVMGMVSIGLAADTNVIPTAVTIDVPVLSAFNNRGRTFQDETVVEPSVTVLKPTSVGTFLVNAWGNMAPSDYSDKGESTFNEVDLTAGYTDTKGNISYGVGVIEYVYSGSTIPNTHEAYATVTYLSVLNPAVAAYYDFKEVEGWYGVGSVSHAFKFLDKWSVTADTGLGYATADYNKAYFGVDEDAVNDWNSGLTLAVNTTPNVVLSTGIRYIDLIDDDIENGAKSNYGDGDKTVTKIDVTVNF